MNYGQTKYICPTNTQIGADYVTTIFNNNIRKVTFKGGQPLAYYKKMENSLAEYVLFPCIKCMKINIYYFDDQLNIDSIVTYSGIKMDSTLRKQTFSNIEKFNFMFSKGEVMPKNCAKVDTKNLIEWPFGNFLPKKKFYRLDSQTNEVDSKLCYTSNGKLYGFSNIDNSNEPFFKITKLQSRFVKFYTYEEQRYGCVTNIKKSKNITFLKTFRIGLIKKYNNTRYTYSKRNNVWNDSYFLKLEDFLRYNLLSKE